MARRLLSETRPPQNLRERCYAATAWSFADCSSGRVSQSPGTNWGEFIAGGRHAARFAAAILWRGSAGDSLHCQKLLACCVPFERHWQQASLSHLVLRTILIWK